jgi:phage gpG-like protein
MTPEQFLQHLIDSETEFKRYFDNDLPTIVGVEAVNFYKESFQNEGFTDETLERWQDVKRRTEPTRPDHAAASRKILTGNTGDLGRSISYKPEPGQATIIADTTQAGSDKDYAAPHNEGTTTAGRGNKTTIPKRQFIGESATLNRKLDEIIEKEIKKILEK